METLKEFIEGGMVRYPSSTICRINKTEGDNIFEHAKKTRKNFVIRGVGAYVTVDNTLEENPSFVDVPLGFAIKYCKKYTVIGFGCGPGGIIMIDLIKGE